MGSHRVRSAAARFLAVPSALTAAMLWGPAALAATGGPAVVKVLTSCGFTALMNAVAAGGTIDYGVDCFSSLVSIAATLSVPSGRTVEANCHSVTFDGGNKVRLFQVTGGTITIEGISLQNAQASTASGCGGRRRQRCGVASIGLLLRGHVAAHTS